MNRISLEPQALEVCRQNAVPPLIFQLPPCEGRKVLEEAQSTPICMYPAEIKRMTIDTGKWGKISVYVVLPERYQCPADVVLYIHGAGWVFGSFHTHEKLVRELAARTQSVLVFPEYSRSPEAKYPTALEQCYQVMEMLPGLLQNFNVTMREKTLTVAGDSAGGNIAAALALMAKYRNGPYIQKQLLYYPVTNACFQTSSYCQFAEGYYLYRAGMMWFWNQYTCAVSDRNQITASPLMASLCQLSGLPDTMILNGEADVLRDEGEAYARRLRTAGVDVTAVRFQGIIHDFVMLNTLDGTKACRAAMDVSTDWVKNRNGRMC
ncbi:alpha/beta hydrolase [Faecalicatena sp. AGMB00832]|uniref:Alpha/beta hydrolase n=1 Tax=Faecalicatena faecalis TaxID=2726362 RepID=A0ABS6D147_9FIRM|nr:MULTISPECIES: alpha/beta hydrolase [Faecalicatena]MBU3875315.1 alpha/beta hydrolase [Faecalicatena faecalis]MCI6467951.1 alpha/beta hydrolase [Faecalicatena sp.]MDY5619407.1 alpha/beta hydrolase [Lachnospiraceae bacterium]